MTNTIQIKDNKVVKSFASRANFVREQHIYEKLKGTGLAPEVTGMWDGAIEHAFVKGADFTDNVRESMSDPYKFMATMDLFFDWYVQYRDKVNLSIGDTEFCDFIFADNKICCIDFEHCKPGSIESDMANIAAQICLFNNAYTLFGLEDTKIFIKTAWEKFDMSSERLYEAMKAALAQRCNEYSITPMKAADEYLACFVCCAFVHRPESENMLHDIREILRRSNQMWTLFADEVTGSEEKYIRYLMSAEKGMADTFYLTDDGDVCEFPLLFKTESAIKTLDFASNMDISFKQVLRSQFNAKSMPIENMK